MTDPAPENHEAANGVNEMENGPIGEEPGNDPRESKTPRVRPAARGVLERKWRRRRDISSLDGLIREHGRLISNLHNGKIALEKGEVLSRAYARHREMVAALEQNQYLQKIQAQLAELGAQGSIPRLVTEDPK